jgi:hypothetical protein
MATVLGSVQSKDEPATEPPASSLGSNTAVQGNFSSSMGAPLYSGAAAKSKANWDQMLAGVGQQLGLSPSEAFSRLYEIAGQAGPSWPGKLMDAYHDCDRIGAYHFAKMQEVLNLPV